MWLVLAMELLIDDVVWQHLPDEVVILNLATGTYFGLEGVGGRIWSLIAERVPKEEIVEILTAEYDAPQEQIREDLDRLIEQLLEKRLIRVNAEETPPTG